jgi:acetylornithine deacetylase/succinyl-diaminopimelate desuccinylase-like protein
MEKSSLNLTSEQIAELQEDVVTLCQELIRIPSVNYGEGKGDEKAVAQYVLEKLEEVGISGKIYESAKDRCSVVAEIPGSDTNLPGLIVNGHIDVVPANKEDWTVDPFSGLIKDGAIWGRGAVDMKDMDAMILAVVRLWARHGIKPRRRTVLIFFADEEAGGIYGSRWLTEKHPEIFAGCTETISEVGGFSVTLKSGRRLYLLETSQKGIEWIKLTAKGVASHGSLINRDNAVTKVSEAVSKIGNYQWPRRVTKTNQALFEKISELSGIPYQEANFDELLLELGPAAKMIGATLTNTSNPTMLEAGYKANVIPQSATAVVDCRTIPGFEAELLPTIKEIIGPDIEVESLVSDIPLEVDFAGELVEKMINSILAEDPEGIVVPYVLSGGTDNKALAKLGITGYGFSPLALPPDIDFMALFHGVDERVPIASLLFGVRTLYRFMIQA